MRTRLFLASIAVTLATAQAHSESKESLALDGYTCAQFLADSTKPTDSNKLLKSLMMISWATGYAAAFQQKSPRADAAAIVLIAGTLGDICRENPERTVVQAIGTAINKFAGQEKNPNLATSAAITPTANVNDNFKTYDNFDLPMGDLRRLERIELSKCSAACESDRDCHAYSYDKWNKWCFLKSKPTKLTLEPGSISAIRKNVNDPAQSDANIRIEPRASKAFEGSHYRTATVPSAEHCEQSCQRDLKCLGYTFFKESGNCDLFDDITTFSLNRSATSGFKTQTPP